MKNKIGKISKPLGNSDFIKNHEKINKDQLNWIDKMNKIHEDEGYYDPSSATYSNIEKLIPLSIVPLIDEGLFKSNQDGGILDYKSLNKMLKENGYKVGNIHHSCLEDDELAEINGFFHEPEVLGLYVDFNGAEKPERGYYFYYDEDKEIYFRTKTPLESIIMDIHVNFLLND